MDKPLLNNPDIFPDEHVLSGILGDSYSAFEKLMNKVSEPELALTPEWRYYKDGKAWLCKVTYKKKTIFWLSVWDEVFKIGFYFTERFIPGIMELDIDKRIKDSIDPEKCFGKLIPVTIEIKTDEQVEDVLTIASYKKGLK